MLKFASSIQSSSVKNINLGNETTNYKIGFVVNNNATTHLNNYI